MSSWVQYANMVYMVVDMKHSKHSNFANTAILAFILFIVKYLSIQNHSQGSWSKATAISVFLYQAKRLDRIFR